MSQQNDEVKDMSDEEVKEEIQEDDMSTNRIVAEMIRGLSIQDRKYHGKTYPRCFVGKEAVQWLIEQGVSLYLNSQYAETVDDALALGNSLIEGGHMNHVVKDHTFKNGYLFYRFTIHDKDHGHVPDNASWSAALGEAKYLNVTQEEVGDVLKDLTDFHLKTKEIPDILLDEHNCELFDQVHPIKWTDPKAEGLYDVVVIGAGAGGLVTAGGSGGLGAKVALIERHYMGGDCLVSGCVPSKAFIKAANEIYKVKTGRELIYSSAQEYGLILTGEVKVDFARLMARMRRIRAHIAENDSAKRFQLKYGCDIYFGEARFSGKKEVTVNGQTLKFKKCVIATGGRPFVPPVPGVKDIPHYTSENIFNLTNQPPKILIVGAGPIGSELGQSFARLGSQVVMVDSSEHVLKREDPEAASILHDQLLIDGVNLKLRAKILEFKLLDGKDATGNFPRIKVTIRRQTGAREDEEVNTVLFAAGRVPNVQNMDLEAAGVEYDERLGIKVNDHLRTTNKNVWAVGDCCPFYKFTHNSDVMARIAIRNSLFFQSDKYSKVTIPWATYTTPEIGRCGASETELKEANQKYQVFMKDFKNLDRALCDGTTNGFVKIITKSNSDKILGATIVGPQAGDMICQISVAMANKLGLADLAKAIFPYPTYAESFKHLGDQYKRKRLTPRIKIFLRGIIKMRK